MVGEVARDMSEPELVRVPDGVSVGSDLLRVTSLEQVKGQGTPLMMEFPVNPATGPFLVSSTRGVLWVSPREPKVRAAFRPLTAEAFFREVVAAVVDMGAAAEWGNIHPLTPAGVLQAVGHLRSYDLSALEVLLHPDTMKLVQVVSRETEAEETVHTLCGFPVELAEWLPPGVVVVVPQDRDFVGFVVMRGGKGVAVVHNASRGIAVCRGASS